MEEKNVHAVHVLHNPINSSSKQKRIERAALWNSPLDKQAGQRSASQLVEGFPGQELSIPESPSL
eukprot:6257312-Prorocentrum_lima.AAC.1